MITILIRNIDVLMQGVLVTVLVSASAIVTGALFGLLLALALISHRSAIHGTAAIYRSFWRGTPTFVQLLLLFYLLPYLGFDISPIAAAIATLALNTTAFQGEIYRSGLSSIPRGQVEAARMLGIGRWRARCSIEVPQMLRLVLPAMVNEIIAIVKASSLVSVISVTELMRRSQQIVATSFRPLETYLICGLLYFAINLTIAQAGAWMERRLSRSGAL